MRKPDLNNPFIKRQVEYTKQRERAFILEQKKIDAEYLDRLKSTYARAANLIEQEINRQYLHYAAREGLTPEEAYKKVSKMDVEAFAKKAAEYVKNKDFSKEANEQLRAYNLKMRVSRMEYMERSAELELLRLESEEKAMLEGRLKEAHQKELKRQAGILGLEPETVKRINKNAHEIIYGDFQGAPFSARLWLNNKDMINRVRTGIERSILRGQHPTEWAKNLQVVLKDTMLDGKHSALFNAARLAITETARVQELTALRSFREGGYDEYIWIAEQDSRTCPICGRMDEEVFSIHDAIIGGSVPPMHPLCRCSISAYWEEPSGKENILEDEAVEEEKDWREYELLKDKIEHFQLKGASSDDLIELGGLVNEEDDIKAKVGDKEALKKVFSKYRKMGGSVDKGQWANGSRKVSKEKLNEAFSNYPEDWSHLLKANGRKLYAIETKRGFFCPAAVDGRGIVKDWEKALGGYVTISTGSRESKTTPFHEIGHFVEFFDKDALRLSKEWVGKRTKGEEEVRLKDIFPASGYDASEVTRKDDFITPYIGKSYPNATEVLSIGLESLYEPGKGQVKQAKLVYNQDKKSCEYKVDYKKITDDEEYLDFVIGMILKAGEIKP